MSKVIQVRGVPDDVHARLVTAAERSGKSLTAFVNDELAKVARAVDPAEHNRKVIAKLRAKVGPLDLGAADTVRLIQKQREERTQELIARTTRPRVE